MIRKILSFVRYLFVILFCLSFHLKPCLALSKLVEISNSISQESKQENNNKETSFRENKIPPSDQDTEYFMPNFRSGHNITILATAEFTNWNANKNPDPENTNENTPSAQDNKMLLGAIFRYAYHINIISSFGFFVGSSAGIINSNGSYGIHKNFYPGYGIIFPTVLGGLVQAVGQDFRVLAGAEYGASWFPQMKIYTKSNSEKELSPVPDMFSFYVGVDHFISRDTALTFNVGYRQISTPCLNSCSSSVYLNSLSIKSKGNFAQLGVTWLVGEFTNMVWP